MKILDKPPRMERRLARAKEIKKRLKKVLESKSGGSKSDIFWLCATVDALIFDLEQDLADEKGGGGSGTI